MLDIESKIGNEARKLLDVQKTRIMFSNRLKGLERRKVDIAARGVYIAAIDDLEKAEKAHNKNLERLAKQHPLAPWIKAQRGIGLGGFGRILGVIGSLDLFPNVAKLWRYMGYAVDNGRAPKRKRGVKGNYSPMGRVIGFQISESMVKVGGPYREVYDKKRAEYLARPRLGPSGCPFGQEHTGNEKERNEETGFNRKTGKERIVQCVKEGTTVSSAHVHNAAMRYMFKCFLRDMWAEWQRTKVQVLD